VLSNEKSQGKVRRILKKTLLNKKISDKGREGEGFRLEKKGQRELAGSRGGERNPRYGNWKSGLERSPGGKFQGGELGRKFEKRRF